MGKRIAVIGAGAIGGYTGGHLAHNGFDVTLIDPWPEHIETIRRDGLAIEGVTEEEFVCAKPKTMHLTELQEIAKQKPIDIAMVSVKSYDTEWATRLIAQYLAPDGYVVSLQNCMNEERIAGIVGPDKTVGVIPALLGAELYAPGRVRRPVGQALGYQLEHIRMHEPETIARAAEGDASALDEVESQILSGLQSNTRSELARPSMGQDMLKGRRTEIDFINGLIAAKGREVGRPAPAHEKLVQVVKQVELGTMPPRRENLYAI